MAEQNGISAEAAKLIEADLFEIGNLLASMRDAIETRVPRGEFDGIDVLVTLGIQRAGSLADRCLLAMGRVGVAGDFEAWLSAGRKQHCAQ